VAREDQFEAVSLLLQADAIPRKTASNIHRA
jgi:hypothetical protein